jgi:hypothetical protein
LPFFSADLLAADGALFSDVNAGLANGSVPGESGRLAAVFPGDVPVWAGSVPFQNSFAEFLGEAVFEEPLSPSASDEGSEDHTGDGGIAFGLVSFWLPPAAAPAAPVVLSEDEGYWYQPSGAGTASAPDAAPSELALESVTTPTATDNAPVASEADMAEELEKVIVAAQEPNVAPDSEGNRKESEKPGAESEQPKREQAPELKQAEASTPVPSPAPAVPAMQSVDGTRAGALEPAAQRLVPQCTSESTTKTERAGLRSAARKTELAFELRLRPVVNMVRTGSPQEPVKHTENNAPDMAASSGVEAKLAQPQTVQLLSPLRPIDPAVQVQSQDTPHTGLQAGSEPKEQQPGEAVQLMTDIEQNDRAQPIDPSSPSPSSRVHEPLSIHGAENRVERVEVRVESRPAAPVQSRTALHLETVPEWMPRAGAAPEVTNLRLNLEGADGKPVEIRIRDDGGQARVSVHTADPNYNEALRERVNDLVQDIEQTGFRVESLATPSKTIYSGDAGTTREGDQPSGDPSQRQHPSGGSDQHQRRQQEAQDQPSWSSEFESIFESSVPLVHGRR